jgi:UDP-glucose 4-epimerase
MVTGGLGFIGAATVNMLEADGHEVSTFDRVTGDDVRDIGALVRAVKGYDAIIHLAGVLGTHELFDTPQLAIDVNVTGTLNVLEACLVSDARYVGIAMPPVFPSIYTATKTAAVRLASAYHHSHGLPVSHVRAFNAFGPGQAHGYGHPQKIIPTFATKAWRNEAIPIWGDGTQTVDLIYVDDLARLLVIALQHGDDVTFDGGTAKPVSVLEVADWVISITGSAAGVEHLPMRRGEEPTKIAATRQGWDRFPGWQPDFRWHEFQQTVGWYYQ